MKSLYHIEEAALFRHRAKRAELFCGVLMAAALAACVVLCTHARTSNAGKTELACILIFTLAGWIAIAVLTFAAASARREKKHLEGILKGERTTAAGILRLVGKPDEIPGSVRLRHGELDTGSGVKRVNLNLRLQNEVPRNRPIRVELVNGFIAAFEEADP